MLNSFRNDFEIKQIVRGNLFLKILEDNRSRGDFYYNC